MIQQEGPHLINPIDLLEEHGITTSMVAPRHDCRCGASFTIDMSAPDPFAAPAGHIVEVTRAAAQAAAAFLAVAHNKGKNLPEAVVAMLGEIAAEAAD
jgi:hypothetical protein